MDMDKMQALLDSEGMASTEEFLEEFAMEDVVPGICMNPGCDYVASYEPDQDKGYCEVCHTQSVMSGLLLMGVI